MTYDIPPNHNDELSNLEVPQKSYAIPVSIVLSGLMIAAALFYTDGGSVWSARKSQNRSAQQVAASDMSAITSVVTPVDGVVLPVVWGNIGEQLASSGAIDANKFKAIYTQRGTYTDEYEQLLLGQNDDKLRITSENSGYLLNLFWALGLANQNKVLDEGEMVNPKYGGAKNFASTAGWTMARGDAMGHYSKHSFVTLSKEQQERVEKVAQGIYRPCCGNSTHFPDCNHGMAMLGLLELMASQDVSEQEMWKTALAVNSYWFPDTYITIAAYMDERGVEWDEVSPQEMLGKEYSSAQGFARIAAQVTQPQQQQGAGSCGVSSGSATKQQLLQTSCDL